MTDPIPSPLIPRPTPSHHPAPDDTAARHSCQFVPPYLIRRLADADDDAVRAPGRSTLLADEQLRSLRASADRHAPAVPQGVRADATTRVVHTAGNAETLPGEPVRSDGDPASGDVAVDEAFDSSGQVLALFAEHFDRRSVDGQGSPLSITVHYGDRYDNAFWDGSQLVFGDGDGEIFDRFTKPMDVMAHEFTHGVTQYSAGFTYQGQSGALNESVSDVFAAMAKQLAARQTAADADWLIGEGLFLPGVSAKALRSMIEPGTAYDDPRLGRDPQVGSMDDYVDTEEDNGGVHLNSGIPNRAFALAARSVGGFSWERTGRVWYAALTGGGVGADSDFAAFARATVSAAGDLFADDVTVAQKVRAAWAEVKVLPSADAEVPVDVATPPATTSGPPPTPTADSDALSPTGAGRVAVRRAGGFTGVGRAAALDLDAEPVGPQVRRLLLDTDLQNLSIGSTHRADRFVYTVEYGSVRLSVPEQDLTPELNEVVQIVLGEGDPFD